MPNIIRISSRKLKFAVTSVNMTDQTESKNWSFETKAVHAGQEHTQWSNNEMVPPIVTSATFYQNDPSKMSVRRIAIVT